MTEQENAPAGIGPTTDSADQPTTQHVDELMDQVAEQLQSEVRAANRHLRKRAARLLVPLRTQMNASIRHDDGSVG